MTYRLSYSARARRDLRHLDPEAARRIIRGLSEIKEDPYAYVKKMKVASPSILYTFRVGTYRAILSIEDDKLLILVLEVDHRRTVYRKH